MGLSTVSNKLETQTIASSFDQLLYLDHAAGMVDSTLKIVSTDTGHSALQLTNDQVLIKDKSGTDIASAFEVQDKDGTICLSVNGTNNRVGIGTNSPDSELDIESSANTDVTIQTTGTSSNTAQLVLKSPTKQWNVGTAQGSGAGGGDLYFYEGSAATRMTIQEGGNVGIGTAAPTSILDIEANGNNTQIGLAQHVKIENTGGHYVGIHMVSTADKYCIIGETGKLAFYVDPNNGDDADFVAGDRTMTLDGQKVGIGTATPGTELHIVSSVSEKPVLKLENTTNDADKPGLIFFNNRGTGNAATNDECGIIRFNALDDGNNEQLFASIKAVATNISNGGEESALYFATGDSAGGLANIVMNQGRLGIGIAVPTHHLHVRSQTNAHAGIHLEAQTSGYDAGITFIEATASKWQITSDGGNEQFEIYDFSDTSLATHLVAGASDWTNDSDLRIKKDITTLGNSLDAINALRPVSYKRKYGIKDKTHVGLIAQEVKAEMPVGVVHGDESDFEILTPTEDNPRQYKGAMSIQYTAFIPYMIKAIQELSAKVEALEN